MTSTQEVLFSPQPSLFERIDNEIDAYHQRAWPALRPFNGFLDALGLRRMHQQQGTVVTNNQDDVDLFEDVRNLLYTNIIIRFDPGVYPINGGWGKNCGGQKLIAALRVASQKSGGCDLTNCNGGTKTGSKKYIFVQSIASMTLKQCKVKSGKPQPTGPLRSMTYLCDRTNTHGRLGKQVNEEAYSTNQLPLIC
ncbi:hypothetical protein MHU86_5061 [Fragilaria crotonensis]|nr:hypothetical protein MHU86_5061 [Fragilaria crotonensis]